MASRLVPLLFCSIDNSRSPARSILLVPCYVPTFFVRPARLNLVLNIEKSLNGLFVLAIEN